MKRIIRMSDQFGTFCASGKQALDFLRETVMPILSEGNEVIFDFQNIRQANSSFANALFANLVVRYGQDIVGKIKIRHCPPYVQTLISAGLEMGIKQSLQRINSEQGEEDRDILRPWSPSSEYDSQIL